MGSNHLCFFGSILASIIIFSAFSSGNPGNNLELADTYQLTHLALGWSYILWALRNLRDDALGRNFDRSSAARYIEDFAQAKEIDGEVKDSSFQNLIRSLPKEADSKSKSKEKSEEIYVYDETSKMFVRKESRLAN